MALGVNGIAQGAGNGASLSTATPEPLGTAVAGSTGDASDAGHVHAMPDATDVGATALVAALSGRSLTMRDPVALVLSVTGLDAGPLATMVYDPIAKTLTAGSNMDVTGFGLSLGTSILFRFQSTSLSTTGVYTVTDTGADDPGGRPAVLTRRADFDTSLDFATGLALLDQEEGSLYQLTVPGGFSLDTSDVVFTKVRAILLEEGTVAGSMLVFGSGGAWTVLPPGTDGQVIKIVAGAPAWATP